jgi:hypothetical protein
MEQMALVWHLSSREVPSIVVTPAIMFSSLNKPSLHISPKVKHANNPGMIPTMLVYLISLLLGSGIV